jgi:hypothetical protein
MKADQLLVAILLAESDDELAMPLGFLKTKALGKRSLGLGRMASRNDLLGSVLLFYFFLSFYLSTLLLSYFPTSLSSYIPPFYQVSWYLFLHFI